MRCRRPIGISHVPRATLRACRSHYPGGSRRTLRFGSTRSGLLPFVGGSASATSLSGPAQDSHAKDSSFTALRPARSLPRQTRGIGLKASAPPVTQPHRPKRYRGVPKTPRTGLTPAGHTRLRGAQRTHRASSAILHPRLPDCPTSHPKTPQSTPSQQNAIFRPPILTPRSPQQPILQNKATCQYGALSYSSSYSAIARRRK